MRKADEAIRKICIAAIKRHTTAPINYSLSKIFETQEWLALDDITYKHIERIQKELPVAQVLVDNENWTLVTTQRVVSKVDGQIEQGFLHQIRQWTWNDFKGVIKREDVTRGRVTLEDGSLIRIQIETGPASMIIIYGIRTSTQLNSKQ